MKKSVSIILALLMLLSVFSVVPMSASAAESKTVKTAGGSESEGDYTYSYSGENAEITSYSGSETVLKIPESLGGYNITAIGDNVFENNTDIEEVELPASVKHIGENAFYGCASLKELTILGAVTIDQSAFQDCEKLMSVSLPDTLDLIENNAFRGCTSLESLDIPEGVTKIGDKAFRDCVGLKSITLPSTLVSLGYNVFQNCESLEKIEIPEKITTLNSYAFYYCKNLEEIILPKGMQKIDDSVFEECPNLRTIKCRDSELDWSNNILIGTGNDAIYSAEMEFDYTGVLPEYSYTFTGGTIELTKYNGTDKDVVIPEMYDGYTVTSLDSDIFNGYDALESVVVPENVMVIYGSTFAGLENLKKVTLPENLHEIQLHAFRGCNRLEEINIPPNVNTIGSYAFAECPSLKSIEIPAGVTMLPEGVFSGCTSLATVILNEGLDSIGDETFLNCGAKSITIPKTVYTIGSRALGYNYDAGEYRLRSDFTVAGYKGYTSEYYAMDNALAFEDVTPANEIYDWTDVDDGVEIFEYKGVYYNNLKIPEYCGEKKVKAIRDDTFKERIELCSVELPASLKTISGAAFRYCRSIEEYKVDENSEYLCTEDGVLYNKDKTVLIAYPPSKNDVEFTVPDTVETISENAFNKCVFLEKVTIPASVKTIGDNAFIDCAFLRTVELSEGLQTVGDKAFYDDYLEKPFIPASVKKIGDYAFGFYFDAGIENNVAYEDFIIKGYKDSEADSYASANGITFDLIDEEPTQPDTWATEPDVPDTEPATTASEPATTATEPQTPTQPEQKPTEPEQKPTEPASDKTDISGWTVDGIKNKPYTGKAITQDVYVSNNGEYASIKLNYKNNLNVGEASVIITGTGSYTGTITKTFKITKARQKLSVKAKAKKIKAAKLKKSKQKVKKAVTVKNNKTAISYKKVKKGSSNKLSVDKKGTITVKKGKYKKGAVLKIKIKITAKSSNNYNAASKTVTVKITIK